MQSSSEEMYQIATVIVVVLTALVCIAYLLIFVNPQVSLNPFKPATPTSAIVLSSLPPTWTPTPTNTPTFTPTPTNTPTVTPTETPTPTPTLTPIPPTRTPTRRPTPRPPTQPPPPPSPWVYSTFFIECKHSGGTYLEGYVTNPSGEEAGVRVARGTTPGVIEETQTTGGNRSPGYYVFVLNANGARPGTWYVWVVDASGKAISDPNAGRIVTNSIKNPDDAGACWRAVVSFGRR